MHSPTASASALLLDDLVGAGELYNAPPEMQPPTRDSIRIVTQRAHSRMRDKCQEVNLQRVKRGPETRTHPIDFPSTRSGSNLIRLIQNSIQEEVTARAHAKATLRALERLSSLPDVGWSHCSG
jgi:hypothetical protein